MSHRLFSPASCTFTTFQSLDLFIWGEQENCLKCRILKIPSLHSLLQPQARRFSFAFTAFSGRYLFEATFSNSHRHHTRCWPAHQEQFGVSCLSTLQHADQGIWTSGQGRTHISGLKDGSLVIKWITNYCDSQLICCSNVFKKKKENIFWCQFSKREYFHARSTLIC